MLLIDVFRGDGGKHPIYSSFRIRVKQLKNRRDELERLVHIRTKELKEASLKDHLTGLRNRRFVTETIVPEIETFTANKKYILKEKKSRREEDIEQNVYAIFLFDIDHFKSVNDNYGHIAGDRFLKQFAELLLDSVRNDDFIIRWGGEEFLVILRRAKSDYADSFAERIKQKVATTGFKITDDEKFEMKRTCSIGYITYPFITEHPETISFEQSLMLADLSLYYSKNNGRNMAVRLSPTGKLPKQEEITKLVADIDFGLENDFFKLNCIT